MDDQRDLVARAYVLIDREPELVRMVDDMHRHFLGTTLDSNPRDLIPGIVLKWLHCACDLELWEEVMSDRTHSSDLERTLDFVSRLEELGIEPVGETRCTDCTHRKRCV